MKINADLTRRASVQSDDLPWVPSPLPGVDRRMLERDGEEVARATSVVRYAPGSRFSAHTHGGGEEFIVLDGVFSDEMGDFPKGAYVRNPVGSSHTPASAQGCTILVKLRQMPADDQEFVRIDLEDGRGWTAGEAGERVRLLHETAHERVQVFEWQAGTRLSERDYPGGAEFFVLKGEFADQDGTYRAGGWLRLPAGSRHAIRSGGGATVYVKTGHLPPATARDAPAFEEQRA